MRYQMGRIMKRKRKPLDKITWNQLYLAAVAFGIISNQATKEDRYKVFGLIDKSKTLKKIRRGVYRIEFD